MKLELNLSISRLLVPLMAAFIILAIQPNNTAWASDKLAITKTWLRATPPAAKAGGGFLVITNNSGEDEILTGVEFSGARKSEVHEMKVSDGIMTMRPLDDGLTIPAGKTVMLKPGGYHLMFMGLKSPLEDGKTLPVKLIFKHAGEMTIEFPVLSMEAGKKMMMQEH